MPISSVLRSPLRSPLRTAIGEGVGFSLDAFMALQADGLYFDTTKTDRFLQENVGPTLADDVGEAIGLGLDSRTWSGKTLAQLLAAQPEVNSNAGGPFAATTGWANTASVSVSVSGGKLRLQSTISGTGARASDLALSGLTVGATYAFRALANPIGGPGALAVSPARIGARNNASSASLMDGNADGNWYYFVATEVNNKIRLRWDGDGSTTTATYVDFDYAVVRLVPGNHGIQATGSLKPTRQTTGAKFDGGDDNWLTPYLAGSGANFLGCKTTVPASLVATQVIMGASGSGANRCFVGVDTSGKACGGVGSDSTTTIVGTSDLRNTEASIFLTFDGTTVRLIVNGVVEYEAAQNSTPTTSIPFRIGCNNNNGTAGSFYGGAVRKSWVGREYITAAKAAQIANG